MNNIDNLKHKNNNLRKCFKCDNIIDKNKTYCLSCEFNIKKLIMISDKICPYCNNKLQDLIYNEYKEIYCIKDKILFCHDKKELSYCISK